MLEQIKQKQSFSLEESIKLYTNQLLFFSGERKKYSYLQNFNEKDYSFLKNRSLISISYIAPKFKPKNSKLCIMGFVSGKKIPQKKKVSDFFKNVGFSSVLKKVKGGFLLNLVGTISFIPISFYEDRFNYLGKNIYLELIKLKIIKYEDKFFITSAATRKSLMFKLKPLFKKILEKFLMYTFFREKYEKKKSLHIFCCKYKKLKLTKEVVMSL